MKYEFKATDIYDAAYAVMKWVESGIMPESVYAIEENDERPGYYVAEKINH